MPDRPRSRSRPLQRGIMHHLLEAARARRERAYVCGTCEGSALHRGPHSGWRSCLCRWRVELEELADIGSIYRRCDEVFCQEDSEMKKSLLEPIALAIANAAYNAYSHTLVGRAPPSVLALHDRLKDIRIGDIVVEITALHTPGRSALNAVGNLLRVTQEPVVFDDKSFVWDDEAEGRPHPRELCTYIQTLDGREYRWTNANFISVAAEWPLRNKQADAGSGD